MFIVGGIDALRNPASKVPAADEVVGDVPLRIPGIENTEQLVRVDAAAKIIAGSALALGKLPRLSALVLAASLVPTTLAGHRFWEEKDPAKRAQQQLHFFKNASMLGGVLLASVDTAGKPSLGWRARRAAGRVRDAASSNSGTFSDAAGTVSDRAQSTAQAAGSFAQSAGAQISEKAHALSDAAVQALPTS